MKRKLFSSRLVRWMVGVLVVLFVLILSASLYVNAYWKPILSEKIKTAVLRGSKNLYKIDFKDAHINLFRGNLTLDSIQLIPDSSVYDSLKMLKQAPAHTFYISVEKLQFAGVSILTAYFKKHVKVKTLRLENPSINMFYGNTTPVQDTTKVERSFYEQISKDIRSIHVNKIQIVDADFDYFNKRQSQKAINSVKKLNVLFTDVLIDSASDVDTKRFLYAKNIDYAVYGYSSLTSDKMYALKIDSLEGNAQNGSLVLKGFKMIPQYDELTFSRKYDVQKDRYDLAFSKIEAIGMDLRSLINDGKIGVKKLMIGPADVRVFMNRELPPPNFNKGRNYPHLALKRLPLPTIVDTLSLSGINVSYSEFSEETRKKGTLNLTKLRGEIVNITNDSLKLLSNSSANADLYVNVMGEGQLNVKINFHLNSETGRFDYSGHLGPMNLKSLNTLSVNLGLIRLESGRVKSLDFRASADYNGVKGNLTMAYSDLKVEMLRTEDNKFKKKGLLSFLANNVVIISDNPKDEKSALRQAKIDYTRPMTSSFFNLLWKGIFTGVRETVGIGMIPMKAPPAPKQR